MCRGESIFSMEPQMTDGGGEGQERNVLMTGVTYYGVVV